MTSELAIKQRNATIDFIKGVAGILIILVHSLELFANEALTQSIFGKIILVLGSAPVAPVLLIFFGYFLFQNKLPIKVFFLRGVKLIAMGFALNLILNANLYYHIYSGKLNADPINYLLAADIFHLAGLSILVCCLIKQLLKHSITFILFSIMAVFVISDIVQRYSISLPFGYLNGMFIGVGSFSFFPLFNWLAYPLTGILIYEIEERYQLITMFLNKINFFLILCYLCFVIVTFKFAVSNAVDLNKYYHHGFYYFLWVLVFISGYYSLMKTFYQALKGYKLITILCWIGKHLTLFFIIQWILLGNFATSFYKFSGNNLIILMIFLICLMITLLLTYSLSQLKRFIKT